MQQNGHGAAPQILAVVGLTASGKTALSLSLAEHLGWDIVSVDAYQVYRGMNIGTAKVTPAERARVAHHLVDIIDIDAAWGVGAFVEHFDRVVDERRHVVAVGGSALYVRAALDGLDLAPTDPAVRAKWEAECQRVGPGALHQRLQQVDPAAAAAILPTNGRRLVRALEVNELTGGPFIARMPEPRYRWPGTLQIGVRWPLADLDARIALRVRQMVAAGWLDETRDLVARGLLDTPTASRTLGYDTMAEVLAGRLTTEAAVEAVTSATRRFARRQDKWFRRDPRIRWFDGADGDLAERARALADEWSGGGAVR